MRLLYINNIASRRGLNLKKKRNNGPNFIGEQIVGVVQAVKVEYTRWIFISH